MSFYKTYERRMKAMVKRTISHRSYNPLGPDRLVWVPDVWVPDA